MTARVLAFDGDNLIEYFLSTGAVTTTVLGGGYSCDPRIAFYNKYDDKVYVAELTGKMIKWDPRTDTILRDDDLSVFGVFLDVVGEYLYYQDGNDLRILSVADYTLSSSITSFFTNYTGWSFPLFAPGKRAVVANIAATSLHLVTYPSTDNEITTFPIADVVGVANDASLQRPYIYTGDKMYVAGGTGIEDGYFGAIIVLGTLDVFPVYQPSSHHYTGSASPRWDALSNSITLLGTDFADGFTGGVVVDVASATIRGIMGKDIDEDGTGYNDEPHPTGDGTAIMFNGFNHAGIFDLASPSTDPIVAVGGTDFLFDNTSGYLVVPSAPDSAFWTKFHLTVEV